MMLMLAASLAFFQSSSPPPKVKVAYVARGSLPGLNPPLEKAIGDWLNVQTVEFQASSLDPSVMYLPNEIAQDVCSRSGMQTVLSGYGYHLAPDQLVALDNHPRHHRVRLSHAHLHRPRRASNTRPPGNVDIRPVLRISIRPKTPPHRTRPALSEPGSSVANVVKATSERSVFLHDVPLETARARFAEALAVTGVRNDAVETVALDDALGRVTAGPVAARLSSPHYHACAMDGIAVVAARTKGALETAPLELAAEEAPVVDTGDPLPEGFDAVIPIELVEPRANGRVAIRAAVAPFEHVRAIGEDVVASEVVVPAYRQLRPADLAACAAAGVSSVDVVRRRASPLSRPGTNSSTFPSPSRPPARSSIRMRCCWPPACGSTAAS
jgi:hypothetical protein